MEIFFSLAILSTLGLIKVCAQTVQPLNKTTVPPLDTNLTWHLPKTADALKQSVQQFYNNDEVTAIDSGPSQFTPGNTALIYGMMPIVRSRALYYAGSAPRRYQ